MYGEGQTTHSLPSLASCMLVDIIVNQDGEVLFAYEEPFAENEKPAWLEYNDEEKSVSITTENGTTREVGIFIQPRVETYLKKAKEANFICITKENKITQIETVPFVIQKWGEQ